MRRRQQQDYKTLKTLFPLLHRVNNFVMTKSVENFPLASTIFACKNYTCMVAHWSLNPSLSLFFLLTYSLACDSITFRAHTMTTEWNLRIFYCCCREFFIHEMCKRKKCSWMMMKVFRWKYFACRSHHTTFF